MFFQKKEFLIVQHEITYHKMQRSLFILFIGMLSTAICLYLYYIQGYTIFLFFQNPLRNLKLNFSLFTSILIFAWGMYCFFNAVYHFPKLRGPEEIEDFVRADGFTYETEVKIVLGQTEQLADTYCVYYKENYADDRYNVTGVFSKGNELYDPDFHRKYHQIEVYYHPKDPKRYLLLLDGIQQELIS